MKYVVLGFHARAGFPAYAGMPPVWVAGIFGDPDEAHAFVEEVTTRVIAVNRRASQLRTLGRQEGSERDEVERVLDVAVDRLHALDKNANTDLRASNSTIEYVVKEGETRGFFPGDADMTT